MHAEILIEMAQASPAWETTFSSSAFEFATLALALLASSALLYVVALAQERKRRRLPPGPRPWPLIGNIPALATSVPHQALKKLSKQYGGVMYLRLGSRPCVVLSSVAAAKELTRTSTDASFANRPKGMMFSLISDNYQTLVQAPHGPYWRQLRKFSSSQLFSPQRHASYHDVREEELRNMMALLEQKADKGEAVNLKTWLYELSANVMTRMLISKRYFGNGGASEEERDEMMQLNEKVMKATMSPVIGEFIPSLSFMTKLLGTDKLLEGLRDDLLRVFSKMVELENHRERAKLRLGDDDSYVPDFVDVISTAPLVDGTKPLPDRIQTLMISEFFGAGTESASTTVEWALAELTANPDLMKQVQQELDAVVGRHRLMQESDMPNLPLLGAIVKETFRLHPATPLSAPRACTEAVEAWGYQIPANSWLLLNVHAIHRDPDLYTNPDAFDPKRFIDHPEVNALSGFDSYELIPFSVGRRMCPGAQLGYTMVHLMLGNLLHSYHWSPPKDTSLERFRQDNRQENLGMTASRKEPLVLVASRKDVVAPSST